MEGISPGRGKSKEKNLRISSASEPIWYYISSWPGPFPGTPHQSWPSSTLDITYYFNNTTLNIGYCRSHPISATTWRVSKKCQSGVWIGGYRVWRGLQATFRGGGGLGVILRGSVGQGVGVEAVVLGTTERGLEWEVLRSVSGTQRRLESKECWRCSRWELEKFQDVFGAENRSSPDRLHHAHPVNSTWLVWHPWTWCRSIYADLITAYIRIWAQMEHNL